MLTLLFRGRIRRKLLTIQKHDDDLLVKYGNETLTIQKVSDYTELTESIKRSPAVYFINSGDSELLWYNQLEILRSKGCACHNTGRMVAVSKANKIIGHYNILQSEYQVFDYKSYGSFYEFLVKLNKDIG